MKGYPTLSRQPELKVGPTTIIYVNLIRDTRPAPLEIRNGSTQRALKANISTERNGKVSTPSRPGSGRWAVEHVIRNDAGGGSSPFSGTNYKYHEMPFRPISPYEKGA
jgi:hypothetical protein